MPAECLSNYQIEEQKSDAQLKDVAHIDKGELFAQNTIQVVFEVQTTQSMSKMKI